jgi:hypothetical protein
MALYNISEPLITSSVRKLNTSVKEITVLLMMPQAKCRMFSLAKNNSL